MTTHEKPAANPPHPARPVTTPETEPGAVPASAEPKDPTEQGPAFPITKPATFDPPQNRAGTVVVEDDGDGDHSLFALTPARSRGA
jgi:hypothetical protein